MFYSENFIYDGKYSDEYDFYLVSEGKDILNKYGINFSDEEEITLTFCYASEYGEPYEWTDDVLMFAHEWFISNDYKAFVSDDNDEYCYLLKGKSIIKRFDSTMRGLIDVTFDILDNYTYKSQTVIIENTTKEYSVYNYSNVNKPYKPIIELYDVNSSYIVIKNNTTKKNMVLSNLDLGVNIIIDNEIGTVTDSNGKNLLMNCDRNWIELIKGTNKIKIDGNCNAKIKSMYPIMR